MPANNLSDDALKVLRAVGQKPTEGYRIIGRTKLSPVQVEEAVGALEAQQLVSVRRAGSVSEIGEAIVYVPPTARNAVDLAIGRVRAY